MVANEGRLHGGGVALAAACLSQRDRASCFVSALDSSKMRSLLILLADVAFLRGGSQAALLSQHALPLAIARSSEILMADISSNDNLNLPLIAAASRALSTHACVCPAFSRQVERVLISRLKSTSSSSMDSLPLEEWSWLFESFAEGCASAATEAAHVLSTTAKGIDRSSADLVPVERILSGALRAGVDENVAFSLMEAFTANREKYILRDSIKAESELLRTICTICVDSKSISSASKILNALVLSINKRLEFLARNNACFSAVQSLARQATDEKSVPLSPEKEKICRQFFGWKLGALFARGNALKSINSLLAAARCYHILHERSSSEDKALLFPLQVSGLNRLSKLANKLNIHEVVDGNSTSSSTSSTTSTLPGTSSTLGDFELQFQEAVQRVASKSQQQQQQQQTHKLGQISFSHKIQSGASYLEAMFEVDVAFPESKVAIEFDGPSHYLSVPTDIACDALKITSDYSPNVQNPPEVFTRRQLREDSAFLTRLLAQNKERLELLCRPSPHHRLRSYHLQLLGWKVVNIPWARSVDIDCAVQTAMKNITFVTQ